MTDAEDRDQALDRLATFAQPNIEPTLSEEELESILDQNARATRWAAATDYTVGQIVIPTVSNGHRYKVTTGGTSAATEPTWPDSFQSEITSGDVVFEEAGLSFTSLYDIRAALRACWELKAAKASELISTQDSGSEQMIFEHCQMMANKYITPMVV